MGWPTVNLLVTVIMQGLLLGAAFPTSGIPELPTPRFPQLNPTAPQVVSNTLPPALRPISTPQLIQGSTQINNLQLVRQQQPLQALNEGGAPLPNVAAIPQQRQPMPQGDVMQMKRLDEHFRHALGNRVPIVGENDVGPSSAGSSGEGMDYWWTGTVMWQGIEMKEARAQITATAFIGNPYALSPWNLCLLKTYTHSPIQTGINVARGFVACTCWAGSIAGRPSGLDQGDQPDGGADPARSWDE